MTQTYKKNQSSYSFWENKLLDAKKTSKKNNNNNRFFVFFAL